MRKLCTISWKTTPDSSYPRIYSILQRGGRFPRYLFQNSRANECRQYTVVAQSLELTYYREEYDSLFALTQSVGSKLLILSIIIDGDVNAGE